MRQLRQYLKYKDSGVEWLGDIPEHWRIQRYKYLFSESKERNGDQPVGSMLSVSGYRGVEIKRYDDENRKRTADELAEYRVVRRGQLVVNTMWLNHAGLGVSELEGHVSPAYRSYDISTSLVPRFVHHLLRSSSYVAGYTKYLQGIRPNSLQIKSEDFFSLPILIPPFQEQQNIAAFLDYETARIDRLIEKQQRLIELLQEKRQAVISHTVTKGLNPDVPMKDSGIEWLGEIPAHWDIVRLRHLVTQSVAGPYGSSLTKSMYTNSGFRVYGQQQVIPNNFSIGDYYIDTAKYLEMQRYRVYPGDVLVSVVGTIGCSATVPDDVEPGIINPRLVRYRPDSTVVLSRILQLFLNSQPCQAQLHLAAQGSTMEVLNMGILGNVRVPLPPLNEQSQILHESDRRVTKLDRTADAAVRASRLLKEHRKALISAAVTGKIDVRDWKPPSDESDEELLESAEERATYG